MIKIAISQRIIKNDNYFEIRDALDIRWAKLLEKINILPIILPNYYNVEKYFKNIDIKGIILTGGNDLSKINNDELSKQRDTFEKRIIKFAIKKKLPLMGICRGALIIADFFKGKIKGVNNHVGCVHKILVESNSSYKKYLTKINKVNSYHNYAISSIPDNFIISAKANDGTIEAIEHKLYPVFAQMWHCERPLAYSKFNLELISNFFSNGGVH